MYEAIAQKANTSDTYTKVQTTTLLDAKADTTTMTGFLNLKADATNVYTKVQIEQKLAGTARLDDVLTLLQLTEIAGGHTTEYPGRLAQLTLIIHQLIQQAK